MNQKIRSVSQNIIMALTNMLLIFLTNIVVQCQICYDIGRNFKSYDKLLTYDYQYIFGFNIEPLSEYLPQYIEWFIWNKTYVTQGGIDNFSNCHLQCVRNTLCTTFTFQAGCQHGLETQEIRSNLESSTSSVFASITHFASYLTDIINECVINGFGQPCLPGSVCEVIGNSFICRCSDGYTGLHCEDRSCRSMFEAGMRDDGVYTISNAIRGYIEVYCELNDTRTDGSGEGGWTVIQRRIDGTTDFNRNWESYADGFGEISGNSWIGLRNIAAFTANQDIELLVYLETFDNVWSYAHYEAFSIAQEDDNFRLSVDHYSGTAGDSFERHNGMHFSTVDSDNDIFENDNCARWFQGGWWFADCCDSTLNGFYRTGSIDGHDCNGVVWKTFRRPYSMKTTVMKVRY